VKIRRYPFFSFQTAIVVHDTLSQTITGTVFRMKDYALVLKIWSKSKSSLYFARETLECIVNHMVHSFPDIIVNGNGLMRECEKHWEKLWVQKSGKLTHARWWVGVGICWFNFSRMRRFRYWYCIDSRTTFIPSRTRRHISSDPVWRDSEYEELSIIRMTPQTQTIPPVDRQRSHLTPTIKTIMLRCFEESLPNDQIARILGISLSCVRKRHKHYMLHGSLDYSEFSTSLSIISQELLDEIETLCEQLHYPTASDIIAYLPPHLTCSLASCRRALQVLNYSYKRVISVFICRFF